VADALLQRADTLITVGAPQSNHARQTAAAAARAGLNSLLVLRAPPPLIEPATSCWTISSARKSCGPAHVRSTRWPPKPRRN